MNERPIDNRKDILLLLLYSPGRTEKPNEPIAGRTRLVKMLFLFRKMLWSDFKRGTKIKDENFYNFFPWKYGPFSPEVFNDLDFFLLRGFVKRENASEDSLPEEAEEWVKYQSESDMTEFQVYEYEEEIYLLTDKGVKFTCVMYDDLSQAQQEMLKGFKRQMNSAPLRAILKYVYEKYPESAKESEIKNSVLR